jgi:two-component system, LytTR family, response regulator
VIKEIPADPSRIVVKNGSNIRILSPTEVYYVEAYDDYLKIFTEKDCFLKKQTLQSMEEFLETAGFLRVHRSYLVKLDTITRIEPLSKDSHLAILKNGAKVPLSRTGYPRLKGVLGLS